MNITTVIAIAGLTIAIVNVAISVWAWRRRRSTADCERVRGALEQLREAFGEGGGLSFKNYGAFDEAGREAYRVLKDSTDLVTDRRRRCGVNGPELDLCENMPVPWAR
jgi:hypothetical protein